MNRFTLRPPVHETPKFRTAHIPDQYENIRVVVGSEETVFEETYVTGVLTNNRIARFKKSALVFFKND